MDTSFTSFKDLVKKSLPISKRGATWIDWNNTATSPIRYLNDLFYQRSLSLDFYNKHSVQSKTIPTLLNDLYDPFHRNISITNNNDITDQNCFTINVPTYLAFGNWEKVMTKTLSRYLYLGVIGTFVTYSTGVSHEAEDYLNELISNLGSGDVLTDNEIWAVQFMYNELKGAGLLSYMATLRLMSPTNETNAKVDFMSPTSGDLVEIPNGGAINWTTKGFASDGSAYLKWLGAGLNTIISDVNNWCTGLYISEGSDQGVIEYEASDGTNLSTIAVNLGLSGVELITCHGRFNDFVEAENTEIKGMYLKYSSGGQFSAMKGEVTLVPETTQHGSSAVSTSEPFLCAGKIGASPNVPSGNRIATYFELDGSTSTTQRRLIQRVFMEYNNRLGR